jgi:hypothetical protein
MYQTSDTYKDIIRDSIKVYWQIEDLFPEDAIVSFDRPHLPEDLVLSHSLDFLSDHEKLALNHIRGHSYANLFAFVEEYIIGQAIQHAEIELFGDPTALRALLRFAEEEVKHQTLFRNYCTAFQRDFKRPAPVLGSSIEVANVILGKLPMAVMLVTLHLELITQKHYTASIRNNATLDARFANILHGHWLEESQHARIDILELVKMAQFSEPDTVNASIQDYFDILSAFDGLLAQQTDMDIQALQHFMGKPLTDSQTERMRATQHRSYRDNFICMGMTNKKFNRIVESLWPDRAGQLGSESRKYLAEGA